MLLPRAMSTEKPTKKPETKQEVKYNKEIYELAKELMQKSKEVGDWVSQPITIETEHYTADEVEQLLRIVISSRDGGLTIWIKPPTLKHGFPIPFRGKEYFINKLKILKEVVEALMSEEIVNALDKAYNETGRSTPETERRGKRIIIRKKY